MIYEWKTVNNSERFSGCFWDESYWIIQIYRILKAGVISDAGWNERLLLSDLREAMEKAEKRKNVLGSLKDCLGLTEDLSSIDKTRGVIIER